jgi:SAM-dependent methyltransferase
MGSAEIEVAAEFCKLVGATDLLSWLELAPDVQGPEARTALKSQRQRMQAMQANPKYKDVARFFIKNQPTLELVVGDPVSYRSALAQARETEHIPTLELMIDGVLADGVLTSSEESFLREAALQLGISEKRYQAVLASRAASRGVTLPRARPRSAPPESRARPPAAQGWWDASFTRLLLGFLPGGRATVVDVACGLAWSALALLPERPEWHYLGLEPDEQRITLARRAALASPVAGQVQLEVGRPTRIPLGDGLADVVVSAMALQSLPITGPALAEIARVLRPGGLLVAIEPDRFAQQFWFDSVLDDVNAHFSALCRAVDEALAHRRKTTHNALRSGISLGPKLPRHMAAAGFVPGRVAIHPVQGSQVEAMSSFATRMRGHLSQLAATARLPASDPFVKAAADAVDRAEAASPRDTLALSSHLLPLFVCAATLKEKKA